MVIFYIFLLVLVVISLITGIVITIIEKRSVSIEDISVQQDNVENKTLVETINLGNNTETRNLEEKIENENLNNKFSEVEEVLEILDIDDVSVEKQVINKVSSESEELDII